jgi:hypothetical protein
VEVIDLTSDDFWPIISNYPRSEGATCTLESAGSSIKSGSFVRTSDECDPGDLARNIGNDGSSTSFDPVIKYQFRTLTTPVKGLYNIMNVVKSDLQYFSGMEYIVKTGALERLRPAHPQQVPPLLDLEHLHLRPPALRHRPSAGTGGSARGEGGGGRGGGQIIINQIDGLKSDDVELDDKTYRWKKYITVYTGMYCDILFLQFHARTNALDDPVVTTTSTYILV